MQIAAGCKGFAPQSAKKEEKRPAPPAARKKTAMASTGFNQKVYELTRRIPRGKVANYGQIAHALGAPRNARAVGYALHKNPLPGEIPCHRVVFKDGSLCKGFAFGGEGVQRALLEQEGVAFLPDGRVDMAACQWRP